MTDLKAEIEAQRQALRDRATQANSTKAEKRRLIHDFIDLVNQSDMPVRVKVGNNNGFVHFVLDTMPGKRIPLRINLKSSPDALGTQLANAYLHMERTGGDIDFPATRLYSPFNLSDLDD